MKLPRVLRMRRFRDWPGFGWASGSSRQQIIRNVPVVGTLPGASITFLRFAIAFLSHLNRGGSVADQLRGIVVGKPGGTPFNFHHMRGGPLFWVPGLTSSRYLFIGHTICPGFSRIENRPSWWDETRFLAPGYDYLHEGLNYAQVPVDLAPHAYAAVSVDDIEAAAWKNRRQRIVFLRQDPIEQAVAYYINCRAHTTRAFNTLDGKHLTEWKFSDYLLQHALPSYAKFAFTYQAMSKAVPGSVAIVSHEDAERKPAEVLATVLRHLSGSDREWPMLPEAIDLARKEHLTAVEAGLGRSLERAQRQRGGGQNLSRTEVDQAAKDPVLRRDALQKLALYGLDIGHFAAPPDEAISPKRASR